MRNCNPGTVTETWTGQENAVVAVLPVHASELELLVLLCLGVFLRLLPLPLVLLLGCVLGHHVGEVFLG